MSFTIEKQSIFESTKKNNKLTSFWSIYEVEDLHSVAGLPENIRYMVHRNCQTGEDLPPIPVPNDATYFELWLAAEALIRMSCSWHLYIEAFQFEGDKLRPVLGS
jgi:hypothetical protein